MDYFTEILTKSLEENDGKFEVALKSMLNKVVQQTINSLLQTEMTQVLGFEKNMDHNSKPDNIRNGSYERTFDTVAGPVTLTIPRDRNGEFKSPIVPRYKRRSEQISDIIIKLYQSNLSTEETKIIIEALYDKSYSKTTISRITDAVLEDVEAFKNSPLEEKWFALFLDATYVPLRRDTVQKEAINLAIGINYEGEAKIVGYNITPQESADNYRELLDSFKKRGMKDVTIVVSDDLSGIDNAIDKTFPSAQRQRCFIHVLRSIMKRVRPAQRKDVTGEFMKIAEADSKDIAEKRLDKFCDKRGAVYPSISKYKEKSVYFLTFYNFPQKIRKMIYSNNRIEAYNKQIKRLTKVREQFVTEDALNKVLVSMFIKYNEGVGTRRVKNREIIKELEFAS